MSRKNLVILVLVLVLVLSQAACGDGGNSNSDQTLDQTAIQASDTAATAGEALDCAMESSSIFECGGLFGGD